jgi:hypothetical protein
MVKDIVLTSVAALILIWGACVIHKDNYDIKNNRLRSDSGAALVFIFVVSTLLLLARIIYFLISNA